MNPARAERAPVWLWCAVLLGAAARIGLALASRGTTDVELWTSHARGVLEHGLAEHYRASPSFNHPPPVSLALAGLWKLALLSGVPFRVFLRLPVVAADLASLWLVARVLRAERARFAAVALLALHPLAILYSGQHGNTDSAVATLWLAAVLCAARRDALWTGVALGLGAWLKLPALLMAPAIGFALPSWRARAAAAGVALGVALLGFAPALLADPAIVWQRVVAYQGQVLHTSGGTLLWGLPALMPRFAGLPASWRPAMLAALQALLDHNTAIALGALVLFAAARRRESARGARELCATIAASAALFYGLSSFWSFQYLAWSVPFWFFGGWLFYLLASLTAGTYVVGLYALLCGDPLLLGRWDFAGHPHWPGYLHAARDLAFLVFLGFGATWLARALLREGRALRARRAH